jgi:hypothetical protein
VCAYLDDILIKGKNQKEHAAHLIKGGTQTVGSSRSEAEARYMYIQRSISGVLAWGTGLTVKGCILPRLKKAPRPHRARIIEETPVVKVDSKTGTS